MPNHERQRKSDISRKEDRKRKSTKRRSHHRDDDRHKKRKSRSHDSISDEEGSRDDRKHRRPSRNDHHRKRSKKEKKSKKSHKDKAKHDKRRLFPMGDSPGRAPDRLIDPIDDYFAFHEHLWVYLYRKEGVAFNDLTSEEAREAFQRFAKNYNSGTLETEYYKDKLPSAILDECKTTKHSWSFETNMSDRERKGLQTLQENITKQTEYKEEQNPTLCVPIQSSAKLPPSPFAARVEKTTEERLDERRANKRLRNHIRNVQEELHGGPKDFREHQLAKKREQSNRIHGASREKNDTGMELSDSALYGNDNTSQFQGALARERARKDRRTQVRADRIQELQDKERDRQENMLKTLGLKNLKASGKKITIAPRNDR